MFFYHEEHEGHEEKPFRFFTLFMVINQAINKTNKDSKIGGY
jgi:hypothetical protein